MEDEREAFRLTPGTTIIDSPDEAIRNLNISISLLSVVLQEALIRAGIHVDNDSADAFTCIEQSTESVNMYLERMELWNTNKSQES